MGKVSGKAFRFSALDERKVVWQVEQDFHGNFRVKVTFFWPFSPVSFTESCSFWYSLKDSSRLYTSSILNNKSVPDQKPMTSLV